MGETSLPKEGIDEHKFRYNTKISGYTNSSSYMNKLGETAISL